jgi:hypothetical protein
MNFSMGARVLLGFALSMTACASAGPDEEPEIARAVVQELSRVVREERGEPPQEEPDGIRPGFDPNNVSGARCDTFGCHYY